MGLPSGIYNVEYAKDMAIARTRLQWFLTVLSLAIILTIPLFISSNYVLSIINTTGITLIAVLGLNILIGYAGQISLGQAAFMAVGAYTSAVLSTKLGFPFWVALPCAGIMGGIVGVLFALPSARIKGFYLAMVTFAAQFIIPYIVIILPSLTGGYLGMSAPAPQLGDIVIKDHQSWFYLIMVVTIIMTFFAKNVARTRAGRAFIAIRDNDLAAEVMGVNLLGYKLLAFFICCFYAGIAGALWGHYIRFVHVDQFSLMDSIWYVGMVIVGGMGSTLGPILGTVFMKVLGELALHGGRLLTPILPVSESAAGAWGSLVYGLVIVLFLIFEPRGLSHRWEIFKNYYRVWPFAYRP